MKKRGPAHLPDGHDPARDKNLDFLGFQRLFRQGRVSCDDLDDSLRFPDFMGERLDSEGDQFPELFVAGDVLVTLFFAGARSLRGVFFGWLMVSLPMEVSFFPMSSGSRPKRR